MRGTATRALASLSLLAVASCTLDFDSFDFIQFAAGGGGTGGTGGGVGGSCEPFCDQGGGGTGGTTTGTNTGMGGDAGMGGMGTGGDGTGGGITCNSPNQCPGPDNDCQSPTCENNMCGTAFANEGAPCNDNGGNLCDGVGNCVACGNPPTAPGSGTCPGECTGGCTGPNNEVCVIECNDPNECATMTLTCPADYDCQVNCTGDNACANATIDCPSTYQCTINCNAANACANADFNCSADGPCNLTCGNMQCSGGTLTCGGDACAASCAGGAGKPTVTCGNSCSCAPC